MAQGQLPGRWHRFAAALPPFPSGYRFFACSTNAPVTALSVDWERETGRDALPGLCADAAPRFNLYKADLRSHWEMKFSVVFEPGVRRLQFIPHRDKQHSSSVSFPCLDALNLCPQQSSLLCIKLVHRASDFSSADNNFVPS